MHIAVAVLLEPSLCYLVAKSNISQPVQTGENWQCNATVLFFVRHAIYTNI